MLVNAEQLLNELEDNVGGVSALHVTVVNAEQLENAYAPMFVIVSGNITYVNESQCANAPVPWPVDAVIDFIEPKSLTPVIAE